MLELLRRQASTRERLLFGSARFWRLKHLPDWRQHHDFLVRWQAAVSGKMAEGGLE
jgi:hypothetical protein